MILEPASPNWPEMKGCGGQSFGCFEVRRPGNPNPSFGIASEFTESAGKQTARQMWKSAAGVGEAARGTKTALCCPAHKQSPATPIRPWMRQCSTCSSTPPGNPLKARHKPCDAQRGKRQRCCEDGKTCIKAPLDSPRQRLRLRGRSSSCRRRSSLRRSKGGPPFPLHAGIAAPEALN